MGNSAWITPTQAIELMHKKLAFYDVTAFLRWIEGGCLRHKAESIEWTNDGRCYHEVTSLPDYVWSGIIKPNWTTGEIISTISTDDFEEQWVISEIRFLRSDVLRCIANAKGAKIAKPRADKFAVAQWVKDFITERKNTGARLTKRIVEEEAKRMFPGQLGAVRTARIALDQYRAKR